MSTDSILRRPILPIQPVEPHRNTLPAEDDLPPKVLSSLLPAKWVNFYARSRNRSTALRNRRSVYLCTREYVSAVNAQSAEMSMRDRMNKTVGVAQSAEISMPATLNKITRRGTDGMTATTVLLETFTGSTTADAECSCQPRVTRIRAEVIFRN